MTNANLLRRKNPGNIRFCKTNPWKGLDNPPDDGGFCVFTDAVYGLRAMMVIIRNYQRIEKLHTLTDVIQRWAPAADHNPVADYVRYVAGRTFLDKDDVLDLDTRAFLIPVVRAMCEFEQGPKNICYEDHVYDDAAKLAGIN